jgi:hypothetical protein
MKTKKKRSPLKTFLCVEDNEEFILKACSLEQAREDAALWNASVIREVQVVKVGLGYQIV